MGDEISVILYWEGKIVRSRTEVVPSVLHFTEVVPKNVARVGADRSEQPQIGFPSQLFKRWRVRRQEAAPSEPQQKPLQSVTLLCGGKAPPCRCHGIDYPRTSVLKVSKVSTLFLFPSIPTS